MDRVFASVLSDLLRAKKFEGRRRNGRTPKHMLRVARPGCQTARRKLRHVGQRGPSCLQDMTALSCCAITPTTTWISSGSMPNTWWMPAIMDLCRESSETAKEQEQAIQVTYTGVVPIVYKAQRTLLHSLIDSIGWAFVMIAVVMMVLLRTQENAAARTCAAEWFP